MYKIGGSLQWPRFNVLLRKIIWYLLTAEEDLSAEAFGNGAARNIFKIIPVIGNVTCNPPITYMCRCRSAADLPVLKK
jgi:hypothetical protein